MPQALIPNCYSAVQSQVLPIINLDPYLIALSEGQSETTALWE